MSPTEADGDIPIMLTDMLKNGLSLLWRGFEYARDLESERWEFAVNADELFRLGLSAIDLRWLICRGYIDYAPQISSPGERHGMSTTDPHFLSSNAFFVLTQSGAALALQVLGASLRPGSASVLNCQNGSAVKGVTNEFSEAQSVQHKPSWNRERKELNYRGYIVKQFKWPAANQEGILMAYEEEGWPPRIDDPLPPKGDMDPISRLHDTIKCLNRNHKTRLLKFSGDGTGEGVIWSSLEGCDTDP